MDQDAFDIYKIPAYQRKGSIEARARKFNKPESKRILVPANKVEPFPQNYTRAVPMPQVIDRRITNRPATDAEIFFGGGRPQVRDMASKAAEQFVPNSVPRTLVQKVKERMAKDEEYSHSLWGDEDEDQDDEGSILAPRAYLPARRMKCVGITTHYFEKISVCVVDLIDGLELGEQLIFEEENHYLSEQMLESMQIDRRDVGRANRGQQVGMKIGFVPKLGGKVWKVML